MKSLMVAVGLVASVAAAPAVTLKPGLTIRPGETWIFRIDHGEPIDARQVTDNTAPAAEELKVELKPEMGTMMMITNNTQKFYDYHAFLIRNEGDEGEPTSVCTVMSSGRAAIENWPYPVRAIRIADFIEVQANQMVCR